MREIKFRAWDESKKVMHHDFQFIESGDEGNDWIIFKSDNQKLSDKPHPFENPYFQQQLKKMQFAGLKDKNGKEIYESDILMFNPKDERFADDYWKKYTVEIPKFFYTLEYLNDIDNEKDLEIVGNIYENPELINKISLTGRR